jgi:ribonucleotide monophosphatase NagD (HAD superfamily)
VTGGAAIVSELRRRYGDQPIEMLCRPQIVSHLTGRGLRMADEGETAPATLFGVFNGFSGADIERGCAAAWRGADLYTVAYDRAFKLPTGLIPGSGGFVAAVEHVTGRRAEALGKPGLAIAQACLAKLGTKGAATLVVGDTLDADILMGKRIGARTITPVTGTTSERDLEGLAVEERPDWAIKDVSVLLEALRARFP